MRLFVSFVLLVPVLVAHPLTFEQRTPTQFVARFGDASAVFYPGAISVGSVTIRFRGARRARLEGTGTPSPSTYILPGVRRTFQQFPRLALRNLYPGIDVSFYGNGDHLEYDLVAAPHARVENVQLVFDGAESVQLTKDGALRIESGSGVLEQRLPRVFQADRRQVTARYVMLPGHRAAIRLGKYDARQKLTIDPELAYTRYFGDSGTSAATLVATDSQGNIYLAGHSNSVDFPATNSFPTKVAPPLLAISNAGQTVTQLPVGLETSVIAVAGTPDGAVIYSLTPNAIYVSSDQGATWEKRGSPFAGRPSPNVAVSLAVDAIDPSRLFVAAGTGLLASSDGGQAWFLHEFGLPVNGNALVQATWVTVSPINHLIAYAITTSPSGLFKSTDAGNTWTQLSLPNLGAPSIAVLGPNGSDLYVVTDSTLLKSTDGGMSWQLVAAGLTGASSIAIDPNTSQIYVTNGFGLQWSPAIGSGFAGTRLQGAQRVVVDATGTVYVGTQTGIYFSTDAGVTLQPVSQAVAPNLNTLVALGGQVYAGFDTQPVPFVMKLDPTGTQILYSTFIGGSLYDTINALAVDAQGNCRIAGNTYSPDFPMTVALSSASPAGWSNVFVTKLSPDGARLVYSATFGASKGVVLQGMALDSSGAAYITGATVSPDFPTTPNTFQAALPTSTCTRPQNPPFVNTNTGDYAFVSKLSGDGSAFAYSTFLTGSCGSVGRGIAVDLAGEAIVAGYTTSPDFSATPNAYQPAFPGPADQINPPNALNAGFVTKLSAAGDKVLASSYLGGGYTTQASSVALDSVGNVSLTGSTVSMALGATPGAFQQRPLTQCSLDIVIGPASASVANTSFVLKLDPALSVARYLTYLGGSCNDQGMGISLDAAGNAWIVGNTISTDFPLRSPFQGAAGMGNGFVSEISVDGSQLLFSSLTDGVALALDASGAAYLAGATSSAAELVKIDPATTPAVVIDNIQPVTGYPPLGSLNGIAPGQLIRITGRNLGPAVETDGQLDSTGRLGTSVANTSVYFDNIAAPILSVTSTEIQCFTPFEISQVTNVTAVSSGQKSNAVRMGVPASAPQILSISNQDGTPNSASNPAKPGSEIVIYASGFGVTNPLSVDGLVNSAPLPVPLTPVTIYLGGTMVQPQFIGAAPGMIAGIVQVNLAIPSIGNSQSSISVSLNSGFAQVYVAQ